MKKFLILSIILTLFLSSCEDFLEEKSQDLIIPKSAQDFKEFIAGEAYNNDDDFNDYLDIMSDDMSEYVSNSWLSNDSKASTFGYFTWQEDPELELDNTRNIDNAWKKYYHKIFICNIVIDVLDNDATITGEENEKNNVKAEAYFLKAYSYFMLANIYGLPFNKETASTDLCVPINNETGVEIKLFKRESVEAVYKEIEDNLNKSIELFKKTEVKKSIFRINLETAYLLASRVALYQQKYQDCIDFANELFTLKTDLYDLVKSKEKYFINEANNEILWSFGSYVYNCFNKSYKGAYRASDALMNLYAKNDVRKDKFFNKYPKGYMPKKWDRYEIVYDQSFRMSEAYLNRAEAYAELGKLKLAMSDIDKIRKNRLFIGSREEKDAEGNAITVTYTFTEEKASDKKEAVEKVRKQRRMELCFEYSRWFDLRRWDRPEIIHNYTTTDYVRVSKTYKLEKNDPAYTVQIPKYIRDANNGMKLNERFERPEIKK